MRNKIITIITVLVFMIPAIAHAAWVKTSKEPIECTEGYELISVQIGVDTIYACVPEKKAPAKSDTSAQDEDGPVEGPHFN